jgi:hypothetical protein
MFAPGHLALNCPSTHGEQKLCEHVNLSVSSVSHKQIAQVSETSASSGKTSGMPSDTISSSGEQSSEQTT